MRRVSAFVLLLAAGLAPSRVEADEPRIDRLRLGGFVIPIPENMVAADQSYEEELLAEFRLATEANASPALTANVRRTTAASPVDVPREFGAAMTSLMLHFRQHGWELRSKELGTSETGLAMGVFQFAMVESDRPWHCAYLLFGYGNEQLEVQARCVAGESSWAALDRLVGSLAKTTLWQAPSAEEQEAARTAARERVSRPEHWLAQMRRAIRESPDAAATGVLVFAHLGDRKGYELARSLATKPESVNFGVAAVWMADGDEASNWRARFTLQASEPSPAPNARLPWALASINDTANLERLRAILKQGYAGDSEHTQRQKGRDRHEWEFDIAEALGRVEHLLHAGDYASAERVLADAVDRLLTEFTRDPKALMRIVDVQNAARMDGPLMDLVAATCRVGSQESNDRLAALLHALPGYSNNRSGWGALLSLRDGASTQVARGRLADKLLGSYGFVLARQRRLDDCIALAARERAVAIQHRNRMGRYIEVLGYVAQGLRAPVLEMGPADGVAVPRLKTIDDLVLRLEKSTWGLADLGRLVASISEFPFTVQDALKSVGQRLEREPSKEFLYLAAATLEMIAEVEGQRPDAGWSPHRERVAERCRQLTALGKATPLAQTLEQWARSEDLAVAQAVAKACIATQDPEERRKLGALLRFLGTAASQARGEAKRAASARSREIWKLGHESLPEDRVLAVLGTLR